MGAWMENRHWETHEFADGLVGKLVFTQFYDPEVILSFQQNKDEPGTFYYVSDLLKVEQDVVFCDSPADAMEEFEEMIINHIEEEIKYYEEMLEKFNAKKEEDKPHYDL